MNINEKTNVPLFTTLCTIPFIVGFAMYLFNIDAKASGANDRSIKNEKVLRRVEKNVFMMAVQMGLTPVKGKKEEEEE